MERPGFVFAVCQVDAEAVLKREVAREHPELRFAFSRPGFVTFKRPDAPVPPDFALRSIFARAHGASLGSAVDEEQVVDLALARLGEACARARLHVFERDLWRPGEAPPGATSGALADEVRGRILDRLPLLRGERAAPGELVLDVIVAPGEPRWVGLHVHGPGRSPHPGGRYPVVVPPEAPSRAFAKLEEAIAWSGAPVAAGDQAVEIGSAPGGASYALARRGVSVVGVDPGQMDPRVLGYEGPRGARVLHLAATLADVRREQLPERVDWLLLDVNLAPQVALHQIRRLVPLLRATLKGALFTLKLNDWQMADEVPALLERVRALGMAEVRATQLPSNRQEIQVYGAAAGAGAAGPRPPGGGSRRRRART